MSVSVCSEVGLKGVGAISASVSAERTDIRHLHVVYVELDLYVLLIIIPIDFCACMHICLIVKLCQLCVPKSKK